MNQYDCDLLVVGLGPVGAVLAALAQANGLSVIAIDKSPTHFQLPRAAVFDHEIMRIFQTLGVAERIAPLCRVPDNYKFITASGETLLDFPVAQVGPYGWAETYALHQPAVEEVLRERLDELCVRTELGVTFLDLSQDGEGVTASVADESGIRSIRSKYLVGCDGSWSPVREALGVILDDYQFDEPWLVLDTIVDEPGDLPIVCQQICDPERPVTYMAMSGKRFRWEFMLKPDETPDEMLSDRRIAELLAPWNCSERVKLERKAVYRFHGLVADRWRDGRVLIAGDAAHQMPPFAGQGMCSGIRDAANLAWKLAAVMRGEAEDLLDSYQAEREPHVRAIISTAIAMGKVVCMLDKVAAEGRNAEMLARKAAGAQDVSIAYPDLVGGFLMQSKGAGSLFPQPISADGTRFDILLGSGPALITRSFESDVPHEMPQLPLDTPKLAPFEPALRSWLDEMQAQAVLVRADRHVFGTGEVHQLMRAWTDGTRADFQVKAG